MSGSQIAASLEQRSGGEIRARMNVVNDGVCLGRDHSAAQTDFFLELTKKQKLRRLIFGIAAERV